MQLNTYDSMLYVNALIWNVGCIYTADLMIMTSAGSLALSQIIMYLPLAYTVYTLLQIQKGLKKGKKKKNNCNFLYLTNYTYRESNFRSPKFRKKRKS